MGSQAHTTGCPAPRTARTSGGRLSRTRSAPMRAISTNRPGRTGRPELLVPGVDLGQVGEAALGEGAQEVQRRRRLVVGVDESVRVGLAGLGREARLVDDVTPE